MKKLTVWALGSYSAFFVFFGGIMATNMPMRAPVVRIAVEVVQIQAAKPAPGYPDVVADLNSAEPLWVSALDESMPILQASR